MKAEKDETTCLPQVAGNGRVKTYVKVPVKGITNKLPGHEPVIKSDKAKRCCLLDRGKGVVHIKERNDSWGMKNLEGSQLQKISS